jgi:primosomal replication protein N
VSALAEALVAAQAELPCAIPRDAEGEGYKYVTLDALLAIVRPILSKHGIALSQWPSFETVYSGEKNPATLRPMLTTRLEHVSADKDYGTNDVREYKMPLYVNGNDMQGFGSAITYGRRYALQAALGIAAETDDDGRVASGKDVPF